MLKRSTEIKHNNLHPQLPGTFERADVTEVLARKTFWPSYNSPYFPGLLFNSDLAYVFTSPAADIFNKSGNWELVEKLGDWFSYDKTPR